MAIRTTMTQKQLLDQFTTISFNFNNSKPEELVNLWSEACELHIEYGSRRNHDKSMYNAMSVELDRMQRLLPVDGSQ